MTVLKTDEAPDTAGAPAAAVGAGSRQPRRFEFLYFAVRNKKLLLGFSIVVLFSLFAVFGPLFVQHPMLNYYIPFRPPSGSFWFGTNYFGQDVFSEFVYGLRESLLVGLLGGCGATVIGMTLGFISGYKGGLIDEALNVLCNVFLTMPVLVLLILVAGFLHHTSSLIEGLLIACTTWTWAMRAIRAQTFSLVSRDFVGLARLSGEKSRQIIMREIAPNMSSYLFLVFILLFRRRDPHRGELRLPWPRPSEWHVSRHHDEAGQRLERASAAPVVVVRPAGRRASPASSGASTSPTSASTRCSTPSCGRSRTMGLKVDHLQVCYRTLRGDVKAVDDVTFGIEDGEIMGLAGESGCGKSTLGNSLVRMDVPHAPARRPVSSSTARSCRSRTTRRCATSASRKSRSSPSTP